MPTALGVLAVVVTELRINGMLGCLAAEERALSRPLSGATGTEVGHSLSPGERLDASRQAHPLLAYAVEYGAMMHVGAFVALVVTGHSGARDALYDQGNVV